MANQVNNGPQAGLVFDAEYYKQVTKEKVPEMINETAPHLIATGQTCAHGSTCVGCTVTNATMKGYTNPYNPGILTLTVLALRDTCTIANRREFDRRTNDIIEGRVDQSRERTKQRADNYIEGCIRI